MLRDVLFRVDVLYVETPNLKSLCRHRDVAPNASTAKSEQVRERESREREREKERKHEK